MTDTASLRIAVETSDVKKANDELNKLSNTSDKTEKSVNITSKSFLLLGTALTGSAVAAAALLAPFISLSDQFTGIQSKLKLVTSSTNELASAQSELFKIAQTTRQGFAETVDTYSNFALAMGEMGKSQKDILRTVETINKAIAISGGTTQQAAAATTQLGQAFASGTLRGDELNSILENSKGLAQAIADGMGVPIGQLRTLGSEGKITAEILANALEKSAKSVDDKFSKVGKTVDQSMTMAKNSLLLAVGEMDKATGISKTLAEAISGLSSVFSDAAIAIHKFNIEINRLQDVRKIKTFDDANTALKQIDDEIKSLTTSMNLSDRAKRALMGEVQVRAKLIQLRASEAALNRKVNSIAEDELKIQNQKDEAYKNRPAKSLTKEEIAAAKKAAKEAQKAEEEKAKAIEDITNEGFEFSKQVYENRKKLEDDLFQATASNYEKEMGLIAKKVEAIKGVGVTLEETTQYQSILEENYLESVYQDSQRMFDKLDEEIIKSAEELEKSLEFKIKIDFDTEGDFKGVSKVAKQIELLVDETKQYESNKKKAANNTKLLAKVEEDHTKNQIAGYANISGAMSEMFNEGSREAAAFKAIESGLAVVAGVRAIMTAGTGDPYTAIPRMVAMAAMVASTLQSVGIAFSGNGNVTTTSDAFSSMQANTGTGSILGDTTAQSKSISKSMEILGDLAKPEFRIMTDMARSLQSIDDKIGGVTSLLIRQGGFAFGEGYTGFDTGFANNITLGSGALSILSPITSLTDKLLSKIPILNIFSGLASGLLNSILGGLFGQTSVSQTMTDSGIFFADALLQNAIDEFNGSAYQTIATTVKKKSWFSSSSSTTISTYFSGLDDEISRQFSLVLENLYQTTLLAGEALDTSASSIESDLSDFVISIGKISLKGKTGDEIQETISSIFGKISDDIAKDVFPLLTDFQKVGEGLFETMTRVASGMEEAEYYINRLGKQFNDIVYTDLLNKQGDVALEALRQSIINLEGTASGVSEIIQSFSGDVEELYSTYSSLDLLRFDLTAIGTSTDALTSSMLYGAGGINALSDATQNYIENYLSESEQVAYNTSVMTDKFNDLGLTIPTTKQGFTDLLKSIDVTTESGQDLYGRLILLSDGFNSLVESSDSIKSSLFDNIQSFIDSISGNTSLDAPKTFSEFTSSFNSMVDAIANGSSDLESIGKTTLDNAQNYLNTVTATATSSRDIAFAKAILINKFSGVIATPDTTLNTINDTLKFSLGESGVIVHELKELRDQIKYLNDLNTTNTATNLKILSTQRSILGETATA